MLRKDTISPELLALLETLQKEPAFRDHILAGGTALALQIGHRQSVDIDLFTVKKQDNSALLDYFNDNFSKVEILFNENNTLQLIVNSIKVDMVSIKGKILENPKSIDGLTMYGLKDISAMKLLAITDRKVPKDYIDIAWLLKEISLEKMFEYYKEKYDKDDIMIVKRALAEANRINPYNWEKVKMLHTGIYISEIPKILNSELMAYNKKRNIAGHKSLFQKLKEFKRPAPPGT